MSDHAAAVLVLVALLVILVALIGYAAMEVVRALPVDREGREADHVERAADPTGTIHIAWLGGLTVPAPRSSGAHTRAGAT